MQNSKNSKMSHGLAFQKKNFSINYTHMKEILLCDPGIAHRQPLLTVASWSASHNLYMMEVPCVGMYYPDVVLPHYQHLVAKKKKQPVKIK